MTSTFTFNPEATGDDEPRLSLRGLRVVDDAGGQHLEAVIYAGDLVQAFPHEGLDAEDAGINPVANIRPEHTLTSRKKDGTLVIREGTMEVKPGKQRRKIERWTRQLVNEALPEDQRDPEARRAAVLGNLSVRLDPRHIEKGTAVLTDRDGDPLTLDDLRDVDEVDVDLYEGAQLDTGVDSLSRIKAAFKAEQAKPGCLAERRTAVRIWIVDDDQAAAVAHAYNQEGDPVNATAAKYRHQDSPAQALARALVDGSPHLGAKNVEVLTNAVSQNSPKLTSFNTISLAVETFWSHTPFDGDPTDVAAQAQWLIDAWDALVKVRPEFGYVSLAQRQEYRRDSVAGTALSIHGVVAALAAIYPSTDLSALSKLKGKVKVVDDDGNPVLDGAGHPLRVDFFSHHNPAWQREGILVHAKTGLATRNSFQTRKSTGTLIRHQLGI